MVKTIFGLMGKKVEDKLIKFSEVMNIRGGWDSCNVHEGLWEYCIFISILDNYEYYLCYDVPNDLSRTYLYRRKI